MGDKAEGEIFPLMLSNSPKILIDSSKSFVIVANAKRISPERSAKVLNGQKKYMRYRAEKDPARGMLRGFFGNEWTERYINNILFDLQ